MNTTKLKLFKGTFSRLNYLLLIIVFFIPSQPYSSEVTINSNFLNLSGIPEDLYTINTIPGWREVKNGVEVHYFGIDIKLFANWKTYWRKSSNTGLPMSISWEEKHNFQDHIIHWPNPTIVDMAGEQTIGYTDRVIFPLEIRPQVAGSPIKGIGTIYLGICKEVCIPVHEEISFELFPTQNLKSPELHAAIMNKPAKYVASNHRDHVSCKIDNESATNSISTRIASSFLALNEPYLAIYESSTDPVFFYKSEGTLDEENNQVIIAKYDFIEGNDARLDPSKILLTIITASNTYEIQGC